VAAAMPTAAHMASEAAAYSAAMGEVVIPMMVTPVTTKNSYIPAITAEITRRVIIRPVVPRPHNTNASGEGHQERPAANKPHVSEYGFGSFHYGGVPGIG